MNYDPKKYEYLKQYYTSAQIDCYCNGKNKRLDELWQKCQPKNITMESFVKEYNDNRLWLVDSPDGYVPVVDFQKKYKIKMYKITTKSGLSLVCSYDHLLQESSGEWKYAQNVTLSSSLLTTAGSDMVVGIEELPASDTYDLEIGHENRRYYTNGITSHNSGKSLTIQNLAINFVKQNLRVVYISLELSEEMISMRLDGMIANIPSKDVLNKIDEVEIKLAMISKKSGMLHVKQMSQGTTTNDIRAYLKNYEIETGKSTDVLIVDYLDLMYPNNKKIDVSNLFVKDKFISEELRGLAVERNMILQTASQMGRSSVNEMEHDHSHISGGISKIQTADNVISILATPAMRDRGQYQYQFLKTRSSGGVGSKITMGFDAETLRIFDLEEADTQPVKTASDMMADLRRKNTSDTKKQDQPVADPVKSVASLKELTSMIRR